MSQKIRLSLLAILALVYFTSFNAHLPITDPVESNYALTAKEMLASGDWLSPQIYGQYWFDKPIIIYWLIALSFKLFGAGEFAARLPSALFSVASVILVYWFTVKVYRHKESAFLAAIVLATSLQFWILAKAIITDSVLFFFASASMAAFYLGLQGEKKWYAVSYAAAALAVLTKGPVGIVLPGITIFVYIALKRQWGLFKEIYLLPGLLIFLLVAAPWYLIMYNLHGQAFLDSFLGLHNYIRATVSEHPQENVFYYYLFVLPLSLLPWTGAFCLYFKNLKERLGCNSDFYLLVWLLVIIVFYTCMATKYITYVFPALFPAAVLTGRFLACLRDGGSARRVWLWVSLPAVFLFAVIGVGAKYLDGGFILPVQTVAALAVLSVCLTQFKGNFKRLPETAALWVVVVSMVFVNFTLPSVLNSRSAKSMAALVRHDNAVLTSYGVYSTSMVFYSGLKMPSLLKQKAEVEIWEQKFTIPLETTAEFLARAQNKPAYLLIKEERGEKIELTDIHPGLSSYQFIGENRRMKLFYNGSN